MRDSSGAAAAAAAAAAGGGDRGHCGSGRSGGWGWRSTTVALGVALVAGGYVCYTPGDTYLSRKITVYVVEKK